MEYNKKEYNREPDKNYQDLNQEKPKIPMSYYFPKEGPPYSPKKSEQNYSSQKNFTEMHMTPSNIRNFNQNTYRFGDVNLSSINNMNINIINQAPSMKNEDLINQFANININRDNLYFQTAPKKDMYFNYYFGGGKLDDNSTISNHLSINSHNNSNSNSGIQTNYEQPSFPSHNEEDKFQNYQNYQNQNNQNYNYPKYQNHDSNKNSFYSYSNQNMSQFSNSSTPHKKDPYSKTHSKRYYPQEQSQIYPSVKNNMRHSDKIQARYFVMKSVDEDNIHKSIKYRIWCSTIKGNQKLQKAFKDADNKYPIYLFFSVNGSGRFLGLAQMTSEVEYRANFNYWSQGEKWKGFFFVVWLTIKDIPNRALRHIINEYNENKPVTASRDTQEIHPIAGAEMLKIFSESPYESSILDDFKFFEQKQDTLNTKTKMKPAPEYNSSNLNTSTNNISQKNMFFLTENDSQQTEHEKKIINNLKNNSSKQGPKILKRISSEHFLVNREEKEYGVEGINNSEDKF